MTIPRFWTSISPISVPYLSSIPRVAEEDGGFRPRATLPESFGPFSVVAADLNEDGSGEVLVAGYAGGEVAVLMGGYVPAPSDGDRGEHPRLGDG